MPLPKSLTQPLRQGQLMVGSGWRGYFAPFNLALAVNQSSSALGPTIYDLQTTGRFIDKASGPPKGWADLGFMDNVKITPGSKIGNVVAGYRGVIRAKYRAETSEKLSFRFREMSRMAASIATGSQIFNLLAVPTGNAATTAGPLSATGTAAVAMSSYSPTGGAGGAATLTVADATGLKAGDYIVCDQDYNGTDFGFVGDSGANVFQDAVASDRVDFIRQTSDYVAGIASISGSVLTLTGPFIGGGNNPVLGATPNTAPTAGAKVQRVVGFTSREGGTYIKEWSAVFTLDTIDASQVMYYYPRIAPDQFMGLEPFALQGATAMQEYPLNSSFDALAFDDPLDGETCVRYFSYYPSPFKNLQI